MTYLVNQVSKRDNGSAARLVGRCLLWNIFLNDDVSSWTAEEKVKVSENMDWAAGFIKENAKKYKVCLSLIQGNQDYESDLNYPGVIPVGMFENPHWTEEVFTLIGYPSGNEAVRGLKKEFRVKQVVFVYHVNKTGRSFNLTYSFGIDPVYFAERDVMFYRYEDGRPTCAASYAHEILHSFGAGELYFPDGSAQEREKMAEEFFPNEIMRRVDYEINNLTIGGYTAYRIGWVDLLEEEWEVFEDEG